MKKVMILGAGNGQIPFINLCKERADEIIVISPDRREPGFAIADRGYELDVKQKEKILEIAEEEKISAILTDQSDMAVPSVAYVAQELKLKGIGYETALKFTNKYRMRCAAREIGVSVPNFAEVSSVEEAGNAAANMQFPLISKPIDGSGSRGVCKIRDIHELDIVKESLESSLSHKAILEEYIHGEEYLVDGLAMNGKYINLDLGIKELFDLDNKYISKMCMFSSAAMITDKIEREILDVNRKLVLGLGLNYGITHAEYRYDAENKKVYLIEIAARGGGVYLSSHLTPWASGIDTNRIMVDYIINNVNVDIEEIKLDKKVAGWRCFSLVPGTITSMKNIDKVKDLKGVKNVFLDDLHIGDRVFGMKNDLGKKGPILFCGNSRQECYNILTDIKKLLEIKTTNTEGEWGIIW